MLQRALELAEREYAMRRQELQTKQGIKQGEVQAIRIGSPTWSWNASRRSCVRPSMAW